MSWTKEQEEAITKTGSNIIVSAGAGSGKTAVLTERTIRKLLNGTDINRLLILTFTNAAAQEMKERIRASIKTAGLLEQLNYIDSAYITTFDSFALSVVKKYHYLLKIPKNIDIMDSSIETIKTNEIMENVLLSEYDDPSFLKLIESFCTKTHDNIKDIIIQMTKKLDVLKSKEEYLNNYVSNFFNEDNIEKYIKEYLTLIFDKIKEIIDPYCNLKSLTDDKYITTFNLEPLINSKDYMDVKNSLNLIGSPRKNKNCDDNFIIYKDIIVKKIKELKELTRFESFEDIKVSLLSTKPYITSICKIINLFDLEFNEYKKQKNLYTFSDIALMAIKVIEENETVKEELKNSFDEIMVDEYQDTSDIQETFINLISNNNVYMVGDIKQSIYRFRHANPYIFRNKYDNYSKNNGGIKIDLLKNFRSRPEVLDNINLIFNLIMDNNIGDAEYKESHQMNFGNRAYIETLKTNHTNDIEILTYNKDDMEYTTDEIEAFTIAYDIKDKVESKYQVVDKKTNKLRNSTYKDFAIIMDRGTSFDLYKKIFEYVGIPLVQIKNEKLTSGDDITIIKNLINLIIKINSCEYDDEFKYYFTSVLRSYLYKTSDEEIFDIIKNGKYYETDLFKKCKNISISELSNLDLLNKIIEEFNFYEKILTTTNIQEREIKIDYLKNLSINLSNIGYTILDFARYLNDVVTKEVIEYSLNNDSSDSVKILNIHKSKGLEYNICYFSGLSKKSNNEDIKSKFLIDSNFNIVTPYVDNGIKNTILKDLIINKDLKENVSEKIRLFYVALTRAKEKIIIIIPEDDKIESFDTLVPDYNRLRYTRLSDMLNSIKPVLMPYMRKIDFNKVLLSHDFDKIRKYNYKNKIDKSNVKIIRKFNNIDYNIIKEEKMSKKIKRLITREEYDNMIKGVKFHYLFEVEDFKCTNNPYVLRFLKNINKNYINCFKEYEFMYMDNNILKRGIIDLMLEYENNIDIIDYKMKNIVDEEYFDQLNGYKKYIENISKKNVNIYLYSIIDNKLEKINSEKYAK